MVVAAVFPPGVEYPLADRHRRRVADGGRDVPFEPSPGVRFVYAVGGCAQVRVDVVLAHRVSFSSISVLSEARAASCTAATWRADSRVARGGRPPASTALSE